MATTTRRIEFGPSEVFLQKPDGTFEPLRWEALSTTLELSEKGSWFTNEQTGRTEFTFEVSVTPESRKALERLAKQAVLDELVKCVRRMRSFGYRRHHWEMAKEQYDYASAISHRLHGMNLTRYLRSCCPYPAKGIRVTLPSDARVWKK